MKITQGKMQMCVNVSLDPCFYVEIFSFVSVWMRDLNKGDCFLEELTSNIVPSLFQSTYIFSDGYQLLICMDFASQLLTENTQLLVVETSTKSFSETFSDKHQPKQGEVLE